MNKNTIIISIVSFLVIVGFLALVYSASSAGTSPQTGDVIESSKTVRSSDHIKWNSSKKTVLVEYSDQQCPACAQFHAELKSWENPSHPNNDIVKNVTFVYRHFPLFTIHKNARAASYAAEAAGRQDKFFEYSDVLFTKQVEWSQMSDPTEAFIKYAESLKLDTETFATDMKSDEVIKVVQDDLALGNEGGVQGTPSFFLNGRNMQISSIEDFAQQLRAAYAPK